MRVRRVVGWLCKWDGADGVEGKGDMDGWIDGLDFGGASGWERFGMGGGGRIGRMIDGWMCG